MNFRRFDPDRLPDLMTWFCDAHELQTWGGPEFRFPFSPTTFREDAKVDAIDSFALVADDGALAAFGQCYLREGRCHFGRVGVAPRWRSAGLGSRLLREMAVWGKGQFGPRELSLFVLKSNERAHRLYQRLGFRETAYPEPGFMPDAHYMVAAALAEVP